MALGCATFPIGDLMTIYSIAFYSCLACIVIGLFLGLLAIWSKRFQESDVAGKLAVTDAMLFVTALVTAIITKLLG